MCNVELTSHVLQTYKLHPEYWTIYDLIRCPVILLIYLAPQSTAIHQQLQPFEMLTNDQSNLESVPNTIEAQCVW